MKPAVFWFPMITAATIGLSTGQTDGRSGLAEGARGLTRESAWTLVATVPMKFATHHPQGMVKIGSTLFVSSVEIRRRTERLPQPAGGYDRDTGEGSGHLFKIDSSGTLLADLVLGEGSMYHPGGMDYDGTHIWVPVAEYRPNSRSIVYRVDPDTMKATEVFRFGDHLGAIVHNTDDGTLHGVSWGSRRFYRWTTRGDGAPDASDHRPEDLRTLNPSHYVDYQDCQYAGGRAMLCGGVSELRRTPDAQPFRLGGVELVDLADGRPIHQAPVPLWTPGGHPMTRNPVWFETSPSGIRAYFLPEDDTSVLYVYDVQIGRP